uniref:Capping actin protein, gelsolin like n=1 Tax=Catharus ustulatus TaxID=91951 RepID=A0A8C3V879_CATUS
IASPFGPGATSPGLHVWQVEQLQPVEVPKATLGIFFSGHSYLVLHSGLEEQAHLHLGGDEGVGMLSSLLGERPITHCNKSNLLLDCFPCRQCSLGLYMGPAWLWSHAQTLPHKGKRKIWASQRDLSWASFNTGDCFLLDLGQRPLMVWCGAWSNVLEHSRMQELAAASRDSERGGKAHLEIVADGEEPPEMVQVCPHWEGSPEEEVVADQSSTGAAVPYNARTRWHTTNGTRAGHAKVSPWGAQEVHEAGCKDNEWECQVPLRVAEEVIARMVPLPQTQVGAGGEGCPRADMGAITPSQFLSLSPKVEIRPQGCETPIFKQFFTSWK